MSSRQYQAPYWRVTKDYDVLGPAIDIICENGPRSTPCRCAANKAARASAFADFNSACRKGSSGKSSCTMSRASSTRIPTDLVSTASGCCATRHSTSCTPGDNYYQRRDLLQCPPVSPLETPNPTLPTINQSEQRSLTHDINIHHTTASPRVHINVRTWALDTRGKGAQVGEPLD